MTKSNITLSIGTALALMITAAPAIAQMGDSNHQDHQDQARHDNGGQGDHGGDHANRDDHGGGWGGHHRHCRTVWHHHHRVRQCW